MELKQYRNQNMLLMATHYGYLWIVKWLIEEVGIDVNIQSPQNGESPLHNACQLNRIDIVRYLVEERGAKLDLRENQKHWIMTPIFRACVKDRLEVIEILLQNGARIDFGKKLEPFT